jgi:predicted 3-demethylubiquinone-9 3-methyltransferase (glyoxalase superfamily)
MAIVQKITSNLWFAYEAEEAVNFYISVFRNGRIVRAAHYGKAGREIHKMPEGTIMTIEFELEGQCFVALNGGPVFKFNEAVSFIINCENQEEVDYYWQKLSEGGDKNAQQCGWLKDKYGLSWQVVPAILPDMFVDGEHERTERVMSAMLQMKKIDIAELQKAYEGK